ncbi:MAG: DUF998 domain-containing protein [Promethearchaeota archaeon]
MECLLAFFGIILAGFLVIFAACITPGYNPLKNTVSSLGNGSAKSFFSMGFVIGGSIIIPFYIFLEKKALLGINEINRKIATGISIITCVCIALVGVRPDDTYPLFFKGIHIFAAIIAFGGSVIYISLFSYLMFKDINHNFQKYHAYLGFLILAIFIIFFISGLQPIIEWTLTILIMVWILLTAGHMSFSRKISAFLKKL